MPAGLRSTQLRSGDIYWIRDDGIVSWYSRVAQAGIAYGNEENVVPTHCGFLYKDEARFEYSVARPVFYNLELSNIQRRGACVEQNDPFCRIGKANNCPGIMGISRPYVVGTCVSRMAHSPGLTSYHNDYFFKEYMINQLKCVGKTDYDFGYIFANAVGFVGLMIMNPFMYAFQKIRTQAIRDNRYLCSTWVLEVLLGLAAFRYKKNDMWVHNGMLYPGLRPQGYTCELLTNFTFEKSVMNSNYNREQVTTPWILKQRLLGTYYKGTYGKELLSDAGPA